MIGMTCYFGRHGFSIVLSLLLPPKMAFSKGRLVYDGGWAFLQAAICIILALASIPLFAQPANTKRSQALYSQFLHESDRCNRAELARQINDADPSFNWEATHQEEYLLAELEPLCDCKPDEPLDPAEVQSILCDLHLLGELGSKVAREPLRNCARICPSYQESRVLLKYFVAWDYAPTATVRSFSGGESDFWLAAIKASERLVQRGKIEDGLFGLDDCLCHSIMAGDGESAMAYLTKGASPNASCQSSSTSGPALFFAALYGQAELVKALISKGAVRRQDDLPKGATYLSVAALGGSSAVVKAMLDAGEDPNMRCGAELDHATPLMIAAGLQQAGSGVLDVLIKAGAEVNVQADGGETALMEAAKEGNEESASFLLNHGADPTIKDSKGRTALDKAEANKVGKSLIKLLKSAMKARANNK